MTTCDHKANSSYKESCIRVLKEAGLRITRARLAVIDCIASSQIPLSAPRLYEKLIATGKPTLKKSKVKVDKVSVYRVLETLALHNLVHRVGPTGDYLACSHLECKNYHHVISRCKKCDAVSEIDIPGEVVAPLMFHMKNTLSFVPDSHLLQMDGVCGDCEG